MVDLECWTVIAIVHRKCYRVDVLGVQCLHPFCAVFKFSRVRHAYCEHFAEKVIVKCSFCLEWEILRRGLKDFPSFSVSSVESWQSRWCHGSVDGALELVWLSKGDCGFVCHLTRSHSQYCARTCVGLFDYDAPSVFEAH